MRALLCPEPDPRLDVMVELLGWVAERALRLNPDDTQELREIVTRTWRAKETEPTEREERALVASYLLADLHRHLSSLPVIALGASDG